MLRFLTDRFLLSPLMLRMAWLHTVLGLTPNHITVANNLAVTPAAVWCLAAHARAPAAALLALRNLLDACDGHIARTHGLCTAEGEVYDHAGDSILIGSVAFLVAGGLGCGLPACLVLSQALAYAAVLGNFSPRYRHYATLAVGAGGGQDGFCTLAYAVGFAAVCATWG